MQLVWIVDCPLPWFWDDRLQEVGQTRFTDALGKLLELMFFIGRERQWQWFGGIHQVSPPGYCIKCITCCLCFPAVAAVQFHPYKLNSNTETCLEKSPGHVWCWAWFMVPVGPGGPAQGLQSQGQDKGTGSAETACRRAVHSSSMESPGACCTGLRLWTCAVSWSEEWVNFICIL